MNTVAQQVIGCMDEYILKVHILRWCYTLGHYLKVKIEVS